MKKILFATTAIVAFAGAASAEVALSGSAEMGLADNGVADLQFHGDIDVSFTMSGETDSGLAFGAVVDLDEATTGNAFNPSMHGGSSAFVSGDFGRITLGDTDGAVDFVLQDAAIGNAGSIADDETSHAGYNGANKLDGAGDAQILRYDYTVGALSFAASAVQNATVTETGFGLGAKYGFDMGGTQLSVAAGFQDFGNTDVVGLGLSATFAGGFSAALTYQTGEFDGDTTDDDHIGVGVGYTSGAVTVSANYGTNDGTSSADGFGLAAAYDLGGGASAHFGYGSDDTRDTASVGLALSF